MSTSQKCIAAWTDDWMFFSRIEGVARHHGQKVRMARNATQGLDWLNQGQLAGVLVDLQVAGDELAAFLEKLPAGLPRVAYGSHVDAAALRKARDLGMAPVMPRSQFVERLPLEWTAWFGSPTAQDASIPVATS